MDIPIRNIYFILSYAWKYYKSNDIERIDKKNYLNETEFFAELFNILISKYVKKGLHREYIKIEEKLNTVRGKINFNQSVKSLGFKSNKIDCEYDTYSADNDTNRLIKSTIYTLLKCKIKLEQKQSIKKKLVFFNEINYTNTNDFSSGRIKSIRGNNTLNYLLNICKYIKENQGFSEQKGKNELGRFTTNAMPQIFENFVLNFYKSKLNNYKVKSENIKWDSETEDMMYPSMRTDVTIRNNKKVIVIDTKFYPEMFQFHYKNPSKPKFKSSHIYQLYAYLNNLKDNQIIEGMLLYPNTSEKIRNERFISGKKIMINNINLNQEWIKIEEELIELVS